MDKATVQKYFEEAQSLKVQEGLDKQKEEASVVAQEKRRQDKRTARGNNKRQVMAVCVIPCQRLTKVGMSQNRTTTVVGPSKDHDTLRTAPIPSLHEATMRIARDTSRLEAIMRTARDMARLGATMMTPLEATRDESIKRALLVIRLTFRHEPITIALEPPTRREESASGSNTSGININMTAIGKMARSSAGGRFTELLLLVLFIGT